MKSQCPVLTEAHHLLISSIEYWCSNVLSLAVCSAGVALNLLVLITILRLQKLRKDVFQLLLASWFSFDTIYLILRLLDISSELFMTDAYNSSATLQNVLYPMQLFALSSSVFMAVAITMERFIVVHTPVRYVFIIVEQNCIHFILDNKYPRLLGLLLIV